jgi:hypothetical protein
MDAELYAIISNLTNTEDMDEAHASCARLLRAWPTLSWADINKAVCAFALSKLDAPQECDVEVVTAARLCELVERVSTAFPEPEGGESLEIDKDQEDEDEDEDEDELESSFIDDSPIRKPKKARRQQ